MSGWILYPWIYEAASTGEDSITFLNRRVSVLTSSDSVISGRQTLHHRQNFSERLLSQTGDMMCGICSEYYIQRRAEAIARPGSKYDFAVPPVTKIHQLGSFHHCWKTALALSMIQGSPHFLENFAVKK